MSKRKSPPVQEYLRKLGNPYASLEMFPEEAERPATDIGENHELYRLSQNPHARSYYLLEAESAERSAATPESRMDKGDDKPSSMSKIEFRERCRSIFLPYIPALEKGRLRAHHRAFIARNESRPSEIRHALVAQLTRYDLSSVPGLTSQFNRGEDAFTAAKLAEIERAVGLEA